MCTKFNFPETKDQRCLKAGSAKEKAFGDVKGPSSLCLGHWICKLVLIQGRNKLLSLLQEAVVQVETRQPPKLGPYPPFRTYHVEFRKLFIYMQELRMRDSYLPEYSHFKETARKSMRKQFWGLDLHLKGQ